jgi:pimeloyl-ACP methyl ester carboxylesterase
MKSIINVFIATVLALLVGMLVFVGVTWAPDRPVATLTRRWAPPPSFFVDYEGMQVHVRDEGPRDDPHPIVLLHGTSSSLHTWQGWADALKGERRVIRFDLPGFGLTGPFPDNDYHMLHYVSFVLGVLDRLHAQSVVLVGNSFGGQVAWETAVAAPERVQRLILVDAAGYPSNATSVPIGFRIAKTPGLNKIMEYTLPRRMVEASVRNVYGDPSRVTPVLVDRYYELTLRSGNRHALEERFRQAPAGTDADKVAELHLPTLILWGKSDHLIPASNADHFARDIVGSREVLFSGLGHVPHEEDPTVTVAAVKHFLDIP